MSSYLEKQNVQIVTEGPILITTRFYDRTVIRIVGVKPQVDSYLKNYRDLSPALGFQLICINEKDIGDDIIDATIVRAEEND